MMRPRFLSKTSLPHSSVRRLLNGVVALGLLLVAVLPHATLAATMPKAGQGGLAAGVADGHGIGHNHGNDDAAVPCGTEDGTASHKPMPACCVLGCGALMPLKQPVAIELVMRVGRVEPPAPMLLRGRKLEPAERPPPSMEQI